MEDKQSYQAKFATHDTEIENGIFNLIISLCMMKANTLGMAKAKADVAQWLQQIVEGLNQPEQDIFDAR